MAKRSVSYWTKGGMREYISNKEELFRRMEAVENDKRIMFEVRRLCI
jgi:hypothetical protein